MGIAWGVIVIALSLLCWGGQAVSWLAHPTAVRLKLTEGEDSVEPAYFAWMRGEALWDSLTLWTTIAAGVLLVLDIPAWAYFGLVGGGIYAYFGGLGITSRLAMSRRGIRLGDPQNVTIGYVFFAIWGVMGVITLIAAVVALPTP
ncbi:MAG TPA: hypothetical protein VLG28_16690 [Acidimicrobiia bacterium]|nr:hypothetical protein [Acidimicrobiia bacterium]